MYKRQGMTCEAISAAFSQLVSSCFPLLLLLFAPFASVLGPESPERSRKNARETLPAPTARRGRAAAEQGLTRSTTLAILMLALLSPRWLRCASWCFALVLLAVLCASLLVLSVACEACGSRFSRAPRSSLVRFHRFAHSAGPGVALLRIWLSLIHI